MPLSACQCAKRHINTHMPSPYQPRPLSPLTLPVSQRGRVILFDRRDKVFRSSSVLQETVIVSLRRRAAAPGDLVRVETRSDHLSEPREAHDVPHDTTGVAGHAAGLATGAAVNPGSTCGPRCCRRLSPTPSSHSVTTLWLMQTMTDSADVAGMRRWDTSVTCAPTAARG